MNKIISHEISKFGRIDIALHHKSTDFYNILDNYGLIDYLKNIEHLGFITKSHSGNNHKRWDYVMLQLYLLHKLKDGVFRVGLSSNHRIDADEQTTGIVILQIAVLFANIGHLKGTIPSESAFMDFLNQKPNKKADFLSEINSIPEWKEFSDKIFSNKDIYKVKYLIALNFILKNVNDNFIKKIILAFFKNSLIDDEPKLRKLKWIFHKVRQISFIYLDSYNSDFPFQIEITKILLNTYNYKSLFNPNSVDFELFFESCETTLTKKLYISNKSAIAFYVNKQKFFEYLQKQLLKRGNNQLDFSNFLVSFISREVKPYEIKPPSNKRCFQFYLSKEDIELFGIKQPLFNYEEARKDIYRKIDEFQTLINRGLTNKENSVCVVHDAKKSLIFNNLLIAVDKLSTNEQNTFLLNYFNVHLKFLESFKYSSPLTGLKTIATIYFQNHYVRKIFLQLFRLMFKCDYELSAYIKFENQQLISHLSSKSPKFHVTGHSTSKAQFQSWIQGMLTINEIPADIKNNLKIAKHIIENVTKIKRYTNIFYCAFPVEIDKYELDPSKLYLQQNPENAVTLTDIDLSLAVFNNSKVEFYIIEGKDQAAGFEAAVRDDFENRIKPHLLFPDEMPNVEIVNNNGMKGGYICYKN